MTYDVNKIIEESVKDIIDSDNDDILQEGAGVDTEGNLEPQGSAAEDVLLSEEAFEESRKYLQEFVTENADGKK